MDEGCKNTAYILYMKRWMYQRVAGGFSLTATPAAQTTFPGSNTTFTVTLATNASFTGGAVTVCRDRIARRRDRRIQSRIHETSGDSTLTLTAGAGAPLGNHPLTLLGTNSAGSCNMAVVTLTITTPTTLVVRYRRQSHNRQLE